MENTDNNKVTGSQAPEGYAHIKGWGIDADLKNDPTYPMKKRTDEERFGYTWDRPTQQEQTVEKLVSTERINMPAVFGTAVPPEGVSGAIRRIAFKYSESDYRRWLQLMLADRVGVIEGIIGDLAKGHIPNIFAERGLNSELKYNKKKFVLKTAATVTLVAGITALLIYRSKKKKCAF